MPSTSANGDNNDVIVPPPIEPCNEREPAHDVDSLSDESGYAEKSSLDDDDSNERQSSRSSSLITGKRKTLLVRADELDSMPEYSDEHEIVVIAL